jgi:dTDP-glucose 4,6-dehydratase
VESICDLLDEKLPNSPYKPHRNLITHVKDRPGHDRRYAMNINKIKADLGWEPDVSLSDGLDKTISWYLDHLDWIEHINKQQDYQAWVKDNYQEREK